MKWIIESKGDPSVGIGGNSATVETTLDSGEDKEHLEMVRGYLRDVFKDLFDDRRVVVWTEAEFEEYTKEDAGC
jgi:hypothetical protein